MNSIGAACGRIEAKRNRDCTERNVL